MSHFRLIARRYDVEPLKAQLANHPELWNANAYRQTGEGSPHGAMRDIWIRYRAIEELTSPEAYKEPHLPVWYPAYYALPALAPLLKDIMRRVEGEMLCGVLITKIPPGAGIGIHTDEGWHVDYTDKLYLSLQSEPGAKFGCMAEPAEILEPKQGELWLFDNRKPHWVKNDSYCDRITLIVCVRTAMFGRA